MINGGVIGLGVGEQHVIALLEHPHVDKVFIWDQNPLKLEEVKLRNPNVIIVKKECDIVGHSNCDLVCISSYDSDHYDQCIACIEYGQHIFVEKPVCLYLEEAKSILNCLRDNPKVRFSSNLILRKSSRFADLKVKIDNHELGELYSIDADYYYGRVNKLTEGWRGEIDFYSVFLGGGVHMVDLVRWLSGKEAISVFAVSNKIVTEGTKFRYDDYVSAIISFEGGMQARVSANFGCVHPHYHSVKVFGTKSTFINGKESGNLHYSRLPDDVPKLIDTDYPGCKKGDLLKSFVSEIEIGSSPSYTVEDIFETLAVCFAVEQSVSQKVKIDVNKIRKELNLSQI
jgi:predicted dehydrogenase